MSEISRSSSRSNRRKVVLSQEVAFKHARQPRVGSDGRAFKRPRLSTWNSETTPQARDRESVSNRRLLERLEAENAQLRGSAVDLMIQIRALRNGISVLTA
jgi:hypothetical protein